MSQSYTTSSTESFTVTHARLIASKVATDLKRIQRLNQVNSPTDAWIDLYEREMVLFLRFDVLSEVTYGFKRNGKWTAASIRYVALPGGVLSTDDDPGKIVPGIDIVGATFCSFLVHNAKWSSMSVQERYNVEKDCPFQRTAGASPTLERGVWADDLKYVAGGRGLGRSSVRL